MKVKFTVVPATLLMAPLIIHARLPNDRFPIHTFPNAYGCLMVLVAAAAAMRRYQLGPDSVQPHRRPTSSSSVRVFSNYWSGLPFPLFSMVVLDVHPKWARNTLPWCTLFLLLPGMSWNAAANIFACLPVLRRILHHQWKRKQTAYSANVIFFNRKEEISHHTREISWQFMKTIPGRHL